MAKIIVHIDLNQFFVRCEEIRDPSLIGKPIAIGGVGRAGIVSTASYKAREYGIGSAMPMFKAVKLCPNLIIKPVDFRFYKALSHAFFDFVRNYTPLVETASIDECYADFTDVMKDVNDANGFFKDFQNKLYEKTKLKCSIGVAPTRFLAKMGSDYKKPMGITIIRRKDIERILYPIPIENMWGIGKKTTPRLKAIGVSTIGDLAKRIFEDDYVVTNILGSFVHELKLWLSGRSSDVIDPIGEDAKSIGNSITLKEDSKDLDYIKEYFSMLAHEVSDRAIMEGKMGTTIQIVCKETAEHNFKNHNKSETMSRYTNSYKKIYETAVKLYEENFSHLEVRLVGITLQNLMNSKDVKIQLSLFENEEELGVSRSSLIIEEINHRLNKPVLMKASEVKKDDN